MYKNTLWIIILVTVFSLFGCIPPKRQPNNGRLPGPIDREGRAPTPAPASPLCSRTAQVQEAIIVKLSKPDCSSITISELSGITQLDLSDQNIRTLQSNDFGGLIALTHLYLDKNQITSLPADIFYGLNNLKVLDLDFNQITQLAVHTFTSLPALKTLRLRDNSLSREIKDQLREQLPHLDELKTGTY